MINENYFKVWQPNMAYILGFITADGCVFKNKPILSIHLSNKDIEILRFILSEIAPHNKIYQNKTLNKKYNKRYTSCCIRIYSKILISDLKKLGIFNKKSSSHRIDFNIPQQYLGDYVRGFFDGDGSCCLRKDRPNTYFTCGSLNFLLDLQKLLKINSKIYKMKNQNAYRLCYAYKSTIQLCNLLYSHNRFCLTRKKEKMFLRKNKTKYIRPPNMGAKPVKQIDCKTNKIIKVWNSASDAAENIVGDRNKGSYIGIVCNQTIYNHKKTQKTAMGFKWSY